MATRHKSDEASGNYSYTQACLCVTAEGIRGSGAMS
ncbi:hypothetical protein JOF35_000213 [Streptomyces demainii]|uniref:Lasso RiPP family leader peptide-containing protein n=1 Tax=Streptomyces demainii TaxID=588122 RepID=A0ABT9KHP7_9ACTN|nr:hypothetical protein [Streptomyces demainii]